jgi:hypothetical protein
LSIRFFQQGAQNIDLCPIEPNIPIWLIVQGGVSILFCLMLALMLLALYRYSSYFNKNISTEFIQPEKYQ